MRVKTPSLEQKAKNLSGGNQQKVVICKWLNTDSDIIIFDEPTRGIDVGAKAEIYKIMNLLKEAGKAVIMVTSELAECIGVSDRIYVMHEGEIAGLFECEDLKHVTQEMILRRTQALSCRSVSAAALTITTVRFTIWCMTVR